MTRHPRDYLWYLVQYTEEGDPGLVASQFDGDVGRFMGPSVGGRSTWPATMEGLRQVARAILTDWYEKKYPHLLGEDGLARREVSDKFAESITVSKAIRSDDIRAYHKQDIATHEGGHAAMVAHPIRLEPEEPVEPQPRATP